MPYEDNELALFSDKILGEAFEQFLSTEVGKYVITRSLEESERHTAELKQVNPTKVGDIVELQVKIRGAEQALIWIYEQIEAGKQANKILEEAHDGE